MDETHGLAASNDVLCHPVDGNTVMIFSQIVLSAKRVQQVPDHLVVDLNVGESHLVLMLDVISDQPEEVLEGETH